jgi:hypothetical protein
MSSSSKGAFKICFNNRIHKVVSLPNDLKAFKTLVTHFFGLQLPTAWKLQYVDEDGDVITVANDFDYKAFLEEKSARVNVVPMNQNLAKKEEAKPVKILPDKTHVVEENVDFYSESGQSEAISFLTAGDFGYSEERKKNSHQSLSQMRDKQRQRALRVVNNLKRHDISKAKRENLKTQLEEINETIVLLKEKQRQAESTPQESVLIVENPQGAILSEVEFPPLAQEKVSPSKKQGANRKRANLKRDLKNVSYQDDFEEIDHDFEEEEEYEVRPYPISNSLSIEEKARKIKEVFSHIDVEILSFFLRENPQLKIEDVIQNYITA